MGAAMAGGMKARDVILRAAAGRLELDGTESSWRPVPFMAGATWKWDCRLACGSAMSESSWGRTRHSSPTNRCTAMSASSRPSNHPGQQEFGAFPRRFRADRRKAPDMCRARRDARRYGNIYPGRGCARASASSRTALLSPLRPIHVSSHGINRNVQHRTHRRLCRRTHRHPPRLHAHPEIGFEEVRTSGIVAEKLKGWGIEVHRGLGGTGVIGVLKGRAAPSASACAPTWTRCRWTRIPI